MMTSSMHRPSPTGPAADVSDPLTAGSGSFVGSPFAVDPTQYGYIENEFVVSGTATSFRPQGALTGDGRWSFIPDEGAGYRTRVLVRAPEDQLRFSGVAVVEWLNVSGGVDADVEWATLHEEILRQGHIWAGVSAQRIGVMGGPVLVEGPADDPRARVAGQGLKMIDPVRYGSLDHPGDGFSFDIFTQVGRALRLGSGFGGVLPRHLIAAGESQSAFALVTCYNGVHPLAEEFDGYFVHSRGASFLPLVAPGEHLDIAASIMNSTPTIFRTDARAPVLNVQSEGDVTGVLNSHVARQPDSDRFRLWEVAGTAHADAHLLGPNATSLDCGLPINNGPLHLVAKAGLRALVTWIDAGTAPPSAPRLEVATDPVGTVQRDSDGIALGGIRTPPVEVPVAALSGEPGPNPSMLCLMLGSTKPFSAKRLAELYPSRAEYLGHFAASVDQSIADGFVLRDDREELLGYADPLVIAS